MRKYLTTAAIAATFAFGGFGTSVDAAAIFFGEDTNAGEAFVPGGNSEAARTAFLSNLVGVGTEDFEGIADDTPANGLALTFTGSSGNITATMSNASASAKVENYATAGFTAGRFATSGTNFLQEVTNGFTLTFSTAVAAFGFYGTDIGDFNGQITLETVGGQTLNYIVNNTIGAADGSLLFWGLIAQNASETFTSITFGNTNAGTDVFGFDDLTIGDLRQVRPVPVPAGFILLGSALLGLGAMRRRKKA